MTMRFSLSYTADLEDKLAAKSYLGHYANDEMPKEHGRYEADRGWEALFANYVSKNARRRAGATSKDERTQPARENTFEITTVTEVEEITEKEPKL